MSGGGCGDAGGAIGQQHELRVYGRGRAVCGGVLVLYAEPQRRVYGHRPENSKTT